MQGTITAGMSLSSALHEGRDTAHLFDPVHAPLPLHTCTHYAQGTIAARIELLQSLSILGSATYQALQRVATNCQDEHFPPGQQSTATACWLDPSTVFQLAVLACCCLVNGILSVSIRRGRSPSPTCCFPPSLHHTSPPHEPAGATIVDPANCPAKVYFVMEGEARLAWVTDDPSRLPPEDNLGRCSAPGVTLVGPLGQAQGQGARAAAPKSRTYTTV